MNHKTASAIMLTLLLTSMLTLAFNIQPVRVNAQGAEMRIEPVYMIVNDTTGGIFTVSISLLNVVNMWGWSCVITWNSAVVNCTGKQLRYFNPIGGILLGLIDNVKGEIPKLALGTTEEDTVAGSGIVASLTFLTKTLGDVNLNVSTANYIDYPKMVKHNVPVTQQATIIVGARYSLIITAAVGGTTSPAPGSYQHGKGEVPTVTALQQSEYGFDYWELDNVNVGSANPYSVVMNSAHTLRAIFVTSSQRPIACFFYSPCSLNPVIGEEVWFDASQSKGATLYTWDFNDWTGAISTIFPKYPHSYRTAGTYNVNLTVTNSNGNSDSIIKTVTVKKPPVLLVHGFHENAWDLDREWLSMKFGLEGIGFDVKVSEYSPTDKGTRDYIQVYAGKLANEVENVRQAYGVDMVDIVAHSMGGLVSRWYIEIKEGDKYVRKLIMLETPNHGAPIPYLGLILGKGDVRKVFWSSVNDMIWQSEFLQVLNRNYYDAPYDPTAYPWWDMSYPYNDVISPKVHYEILGGWAYSLFSEVFDLDTIAVPTSKNVFNEMDHSDLINDMQVISRVVYLLNDDPEPLEPNEEDSPFQFASVISSRILPDEQQSFEISISSTSEANFILSWPEGNLNLTLNSPSGRLIDPYIAEIDVNITYYQDENTKGYSVESPEFGIWKANVMAANITGEEDYALLILLNTTITLTLDPQKSQYDPFEPMLITANLAYGNSSITSASMDAEILKPDDNTETMILYDDGLHDDNLTNDGIYANTFMNTSLWGTYCITVTANGSLNEEQFTRQAFTVAWVEQYPDLALNESDIIFSKETATEGEIITINATVHNIGEANADNASILFYDGNPTNGTLIGEYTLNVISGEAEIASIQWNATRGTHQINVQVSPYNEFLELNYTNNIASRAIRATGHNIALLTIMTSKTVMGQTYEMPIDVIVENQGDFQEDFNLTLLANTTIIGKLTVGNVPNGTWTILTFKWNTTGFARGNYAISAYAWPVSGETDTEDNNCTGGLVVVTWLGDLNGDFVVDEDDLWHFCGAFIDYYKIHRLDPNCDFDNNNKIDEDDLWAFCGAFIDYWKAH